MDPIMIIQMMPNNWFILNLINLLIILIFMIKLNKKFMMKSKKLIINK